MAVLTVQNLSLTGLAATLAAATATTGDKFDNPTDERTFLRVTNGSGASINVTITAQAANINVSGYGLVALANQVVAVAAGASKDIGPFPAALWNDANGQVNFVCSAVTSVTVGAIRMARAS
jgi:hypothetical protein